MPAIHLFCENCLRKTSIIVISKTKILGSDLRFRKEIYESLFLLPDIGT